MTAAGRGSKLDQGQLTRVDYWEEHWSRAHRRETYENLGWVSRSYPFVALDRLLRSVLTVDSSRSFLEVGSGPGRWMIYFHKTFGYRVSGCDTSPRSCEWARENLAAAGVVATIHQADFFAIEGSYDIVFSVESWSTSRIRRSRSRRSSACWPRAAS